MSLPVPNSFRFTATRVCSVGQPTIEGTLSVQSLRPFVCCGTSRVRCHRSPALAYPRILVVERYPMAVCYDRDAAGVLLCRKMTSESEQHIVKRCAGLDFFMKRTSRV